uniref:T cell activation inhibitor, mitochondrial n=1 Tax=Microcebus murinus TaxID=30608 RepID=A0A8C5W9E4_MICMU
MFCHLRPVRRLCLEKIFSPWFVYSRALSAAEAVNALRPFYFAVHPDFFGQHPKEREVNENSLKTLSVYLENLQKPSFKSLKPTQLRFYVRGTDQNSSDGHELFSTSGFRAVKFTLHTRDLLSTALYILNSCSLSIEHIQSSNTNVHSQPLKEAKRMSDRPIKWDNSYYSFTGFRDPDEDLEQVSRMETTLTSWLDNNGKSAVKKLKHSLPLRKELDRLKDELWQRSWGIAHRCSQLHSLGRLAQQNLETLKKAKGCTYSGHVVLGTMDVHHYWVKLPSYFDLQRKLMLLEDQISYLLGGIQVVYIDELQPVLTLEEITLFLMCSIIGYWNRMPFHSQSLCGLQMILNSDRYAPSLHELGISTIPVLCDLANLQWFILTKAQQARENMKRKEELKVIENELIQVQQGNFSGETSRTITALSTWDAPVCSHFYSVMQDRDLCIPWNWKNEKPLSNRNLFYFLKR